MAKMNFQRNFKKGFAQKEIMEDLKAFIGSAFYVIVPTLVGANGLGGMAVGGLGLYFLGKAIDQPALCKAAIANIASHLIYTYGDTALAGNDSINGGNGLWKFRDVSSGLIPVWSIEGAREKAAGTGVNDYLSEGEMLPPGTRVEIRNGEALAVYDGNASLNDYYYYDDGSALSGYYYDEGDGAYAPALSGIDEERF